MGSNATNKLMLNSRKSSDESCRQIGFSKSNLSVVTRQTYVCFTNPGLVKQTDCIFQALPVCIRQVLGFLQIFVPVSTLFLLVDCVGYPKALCHMCVPLRNYYRHSLTG